MDDPHVSDAQPARLVDAHCATLSALLGTLRSRALDDTTARGRAIDLVVAALLELNAPPDRGPDAVEENVHATFTRLAVRLGPLVRDGGVGLELAAPESRRTLPSTVASVATAATRGSVLALLEQPDVNRIRVSWQAGDTELRMVVRDDGSGALDTRALAVYHVPDRLTALDGTLTVDKQPEWGTTVTATLPLAPPPAEPRPDPLRGLNPRELDVLRQIVLGRRNREIGRVLRISEHTVKFHVTNILLKLSVSSRVQAAALARDAIPS